MKRKLCITLLSLLLTSSVIFTGCSSNDNSDAPSANQDGSAETEKDASNEEEKKDEDNTLEKSDAQEENTENTNTDSAMQEEKEENDKSSETKNTNVKTEKKKIIMYTTVNLILRKKGSMDAEKLEILPINTKVTVLKKGKEWYKVKAKGKTGFVFAEYLTKDQNVAKEAAALAAEEEARAAAEAAAAAQNTYTAPQNNNTAGGSKTEVSREDYPDCDGSGHGYSEIHYSDGSVEIVEY